MPARGRGRALRTLAALFAVWAIAAYLFVPWVWREYFTHDPAADDIANITLTGDGHPGDPLNLKVIGSEEHLIRALAAAGWLPADPITFDTSVRIVVDSVLRRPDAEAPVSALYLFGRKQDLAFEQPIGHSPARRHHVRFWRVPSTTELPTSWLGAVTLDERVGLSHTTGQVTHHISADVDAERDRIVTQLTDAGWVQTVDWIAGFHVTREGRNGGGDLWRTDGRLAKVELKARPGD